jgi:hypothetical protein
MRFILYIIFFLAINCSAFAQFGACRDSAQIQSNSACGSQGFFPVCSNCNGKATTYRNECFANKDGILYSYNPGQCEEFAIDFYPNAISDANAESFKPTILSRNKIGSTIYIMDVYGVIYDTYQIFSSSYTSYVQSTPAFQDVINLARLNHGMYLFVFSGANQLIVQKFVRMD